MPAGAHAADTVVAELAGREPEPFRFGYIAQSSASAGATG